MSSLEADAAPNAAPQDSDEPHIMIPVPNTPSPPPSPIPQQQTKRSRSRSSESFKKRDSKRRRRRSASSSSSSDSESSEDEKRKTKRRRRSRSKSYSSSSSSSSSDNYRSRRHSSSSRSPSPSERRSRRRRSRSSRRRSSSSSRHSHRRDSRRSSYRDEEDYKSRSSSSRSKTSPSRITVPTPPSIPSISSSSPPYPTKHSSVSSSAPANGSSSASVPSSSFDKELFNNPYEHQQFLLQQQIVAASIAAQHAKQQNNECRVYVGNIHFEANETHLNQIFSNCGTIKNITLFKDPTTKRHRGFAFIDYPTPEEAAFARERMAGFTLMGRTLKVGKPNQGQQQQSSPTSAGSPIGFGGRGQAGGGIMLPTLQGVTPAQIIPSSKVTTASAVSQAEAEEEQSSMPIKLPHEFQTVSPSPTGKDPLAVIQEFTAKLSASAAPSTKVYIGSVHYQASETELRKIFGVCGQIVSCHMMTEPTGKHRGFGFIDYATTEQAQHAIRALNGFEYMGRKLKVGPAVGASAPPPDFPQRRPK